MLTTPKAKKELFLASSLCDGVEDNNIRQVTTLLDSKEADPNVIIPIYGITPFHLAIGNPSETFAEDVTKLFLRHGGDPNIRSTEGLTPVHIAAAWGRCKVLELLLLNGGDPLYLDNEGYSPFHFAFDGVHYAAVSILRKYCGDYTNDEEDEIKYNMALEKVLINNKNVIAEYVVTDEHTTGTSNLSPENFLEVNIKSSDGSSSSDFKLFLNNDFVTRRRTRKALQNQKENDKLSDETETNFKEKSTQEEKHTLEEKNIIRQIISHLSTSFSSDVTKTDITHNSDSYLYEKRMRLFPKILNSSGRKSNQATKRRNEFSENLIRSKLKNKLKEESSSTKVVSSLRSEMHKNRSPLFERDNNVFDHSIVSKSPNCNILTRLEKKKTIEKSPTVNKHTPKSLDNSIISKSPNCAIMSSSDKKKKLSKISTFGKNITPTIMKKPSSKIISRTPCGLSSKAYISNSQKAAQISKSLPKNFQNKISQEQESPFFKKPVYVNKKINSGVKKKDTEDSSGISSASSKLTHLKNVAIKLEDYISEDFDSLSHNNDVNSTRIAESFKQRVSSFLSNDEKYSNTSLENMTSEISESNSKNNFQGINSTQEITSLKNDMTNNDSRFQVQRKSNLFQQSLLSLNQFETKDNGEKCKNSSKESKDSIITDDLTERSFMNRHGNETFVSIEEEYKYKDFEEGVILMERRLCITPSCVMINKEELTSFYTCSTAESVSSLPQEMLLIDKQILRQRLTELGENPGPITSSTQRVYLKRLMKLEDMKQNVKNVPSYENLAGKIETHSIKSSLIALNWQTNLQLYKERENKIFQEFARPDPSRKWREGLTKTCFNYLLLDSRITKDLPNRATNLSLQEKWETFLSSIFYIGKGKQSRPYAHLYDAFHLWVSNKPADTSNKKIKQILDIWNDKQGVVVLHIFHNTIPVEAYTREAAMIDALGVETLANCKGGEYYGKVATWTNKEKCELGQYLLYKAMEILMAEGERHLFPEHL